MTTTAQPLSEVAFFEQVRTLLNLYRWRWVHQHDSRRSNAGLPDIIALRPPRLIMAELKRDDGRVSRSQQEWLSELGAVPGIEVYLWRPADLEQIRRILSWETETRP